MVTVGVLVRVGAVVDVVLSSLSFVVRVTATLSDMVPLERRLARADELPLVGVRGAFGEFFCVVRGTLLGD